LTALEAADLMLIEAHPEATELEKRLAWDLRRFLLEGRGSYTYRAYYNNARAAL
jgi:hypothetical protein